MCYLFSIDSFMNHCILSHNLTEHQRNLSTRSKVGKFDKDFLLLLSGKKTARILRICYCEWLINNNNPRSILARQQHLNYDKHHWNSRQLFTRHTLSNETGHSQTLWHSILIQRSHTIIMLADKKCFGGRSIIKLNVDFFEMRKSLGS